MATIDIGDLEALCMDMKELANIPISVIDEMLNAEADIIIEAQKKSAVSMGVQDTGLSISSIGKGKPSTTIDGRVISVYPRGTRTRNGITTRNGEIAFINEFGKRGQPARPFIATANEQNADKAIDAAEQVYNNYLKTKGF